MDIFYVIIMIMISMSSLLSIISSNVGLQSFNATNVAWRRTHNVNSSILTLNRLFSSGILLLSLIGLGMHLLFRSYKIKLF